MIKISEPDFTAALIDAWNQGYDQAIACLQSFAESADDAATTRIIAQVVRLLEVTHPKLGGSMVRHVSDAMH